MTRTMWDSTTAADIPADAELIAAYSDGLYVDAAAAKADHPTATIVTIAVDPAFHQAQVYDCERGNGVPADAPGWLAGARAAGQDRPTVYCNLSTAPAVVSACGHGVDLWVADWTGKPHQAAVAGANVVGVQYADPNDGSGGHYDLSVIYDDSWHGSAPAPAPPPAPPLAPRFPLPAGDWYGRPSSDPHNHSGYYWAGDRPGIREIQAHLRVTVDGLYGNGTFAAVVGFQRGTGIRVDGLVGAVTWGRLFPVA